MGYALDIGGDLANGGVFKSSREFRQGNEMSATSDVVFWIDFLGILKLMLFLDAI